MRNNLEHQTPLEKDSELIDNVAKVMSQLSDFDLEGYSGDYSAKKET